MHHLVAPFDADHQRAAQAFVREALAGAGFPERPGPTWPPHLTLVSYDSLAPEAAVDAVQAVAATTAPLTVHAHGFGVFSGDAPRQLCLFVPVVRDTALDRLQRRLRAALKAAGAAIDGQSHPRVWTPHVTLLDRCLDPARLAQALERLTRRPHPSWNIGLDRLAVQQTTLPLIGTRTPTPRRSRLR